MATEHHYDHATPFANVENEKQRCRGSYEKRRPAGTIGFSRYYVANPTVVFYKRDDRTKRETHSAPPSARPHSKLCGPRQDQA